MALLMVMVGDSWYEDPKEPGRMLGANEDHEGAIFHGTGGFAKKGMNSSKSPCPIPRTCDLQFGNNCEGDADLELVEPWQK